MVAPWVTNEMKNVDLKDVRLNERLVEVLGQLGEQPTASISAACGGYAEMTAAYRLFDNEKVSFDNVLQPHLEATRRRMAEQAVVVLVPDTTEIGLPGRPSSLAAAATAELVGDGADGGAARRLRKPQTGRSPGSANNLAGPSTPARPRPLLATVRPRSTPRADRRGH